MITEEQFIKKYGLKKYKELININLSDKDIIDEYLSKIGFSKKEEQKDFFSRYISKTYFITDNDILSIFNKYKWKENKFNKLQIIQLTHIKDELVNYFSSEKGNLSIKKVDAWTTKNNINFEIFLYKLKFLVSSLEKRKKESKTLKNFIKQLERKLKPSNKKPQPLALKEDVKASELMGELRDLKEKFLTGSNKEFIKLIHNNIEMDYSIKSLEDFFYKK